MPVWPLYILDLQSVTLMSCYSYYHPLTEACIKYLIFPSKDSNVHLPDTSLKPFWTAPTNTWLSTAEIRAGTAALASASRGEQGCSQAHRELWLVLAQPAPKNSRAHTGTFSTQLCTPSQLQTCPFSTSFWIKNKPIHPESYHFQLSEISKISIFQNIIIISKVVSPA